MAHAAWAMCVVHVVRTDCFATHCANRSTLRWIDSGVFADDRAVYQLWDAILLYFPLPVYLTSS
jgi:hypothetical protein